LPWAECGDAREPYTAITTFGGACRLLEVMIYEFSTGGFDNASSVRVGVVGLAFAKRDTLSHC